ncbi:MAG TPA: AbrB/MazE/SpoVT family DNA-binding domain-containing protein [Rhizomicrobium sp.]
MTIAQSKLTAQGQISVPSEIRRRLGVGPGSVLEWEEEGGRIVVRKAGRYSSEDLHRALFPEGQSKGPRVDVDDAIRAHIRKKHARD